jgi:Ca2+-binding RTX toxin-like protein
VSTWGNFTLGDGVDNLVANGAYAHTLTGNALANVITGADGNDVIDGRGGNDDLFGEGGADTFLFSNARGRDTVMDFSRADGDRIDLDYSLLHLGRIDSFEELQHRIDQGLITVSYTDDSVSLDFHFPSGEDVLTIRSVNDLQASDWSFAPHTA